ncbi:protein adenylyltransferase SelO family protein [Pelagicoccus sp. SDUM812002]|uniref:protein adenylyltransferase SelO n=1 Tax=Pelagicoccus sp. SDUM812002 TaxID=3041266 RepID=UPI00280EDAC5|nr:YdiU family protein [Pelagicoccus sp. SDUM812002]MDQ8184877.1 YdiU family protein [Pelagicoccus sp. SDUM812002]
MNISFDNTYARLPERFFKPQLPAKVPAPELIRVNRELAGELGIDAEWLESDEGLSVLAGNAIAEGSEPIAQAYAGHQFGHFVPQLGDGRAILLGEVVSGNGKRYDLQLKGSGRTAFSRAGDGKSALGPVIREYILSEAMAALGVPTTRALAAVATGETVYRQEGEVPGGVFTRVASSHVRVGTFQYFQSRGDVDAIRSLADFVIKRHYPEALQAEDPYLALLRNVVERQASLVAQWMSLGFIHGVMNTDNMAVSGETIDYGPCAFMEVFHPECVFSSIDRNARYAWGNQGNIAFWNLTRLAEALLPVIDEKPEDSSRKAEAVLNEFTDRFADQYVARFKSKLGSSEVVSKELIQETLQLLASQEVDFTLFFRHLTRSAGGASTAELEDLFKNRDTFGEWFSKWSAMDVSTEGLQAMQRANPILTPRNHRVEQAIQAAYRSDYSVFHRLVNALATPFVDDPANRDLEARPLPEEVVHQTFCGT